ncbi:immunoglobulin-like domain-containing protein [Halorhabdus salina]|uniref:immunoglobulin-like domain-containing protein n=1 Tax=Halorhabdus salina TaxID=2750670 RepID=UPI0015EEE710|nr:immunoglobulin-like domain-containing protein [Halorhabdus salina]
MFEKAPLVIAIALVVTTAGCLGVVDSSGSPSAETTTTDRITDCTGDLERLDIGITTDFLPQQDANFTIEANRTTLTRGDSLEITLRNVDDESHGTGTERMFVLQRYVDGEWQTVLGAQEGRTGWNATLVTHEPGSGYTWTVRLTDNGFSEWGYEPCTSMPPGEYRFVYHGLVESGTYDGEIPDPSVAVEFRIVP